MVEGVVFTEEPSGVRLRAVGVDAAFGPAYPLEVLAVAFARFVAEARDRFGPRWRTCSGAAIPADDFDELVRRVVVHWMVFCRCTGRPLEIQACDWDHPASWRIVQEVVERRHRRGTPEATRACAALMGVSEAEYLAWKEGDERFLDR